MSILKISGDTLVSMDWDVEEILSDPKEQIITRLVDEEYFDKVSICGLTYREIQELDRYSL